MDMTTVSPEEKFGIKFRSAPGPRTVDQSYSFLLGCIAIVLGILGFILTGVTNYTEMTDHFILWVFQTNGFHNTLYIILGVLWFIGAFTLTPAGNQGMNIAIGALLLLVGVMGFMGYWSLLSIPQGVNGDNILDVVLGVATLIIGGGALSVGSQRT